MTAPELATEGPAVKGLVVKGLRRRPQLSEDVAAHIRSQIMSGVLRPGVFVRIDDTAVELGVSATPVREALQRLRDLGYLQQSGERGGASYLLAKELGPPAGVQLSATELEALVVALATDGRVTNEQVRSRTGLDRGQVLALLSRLVENGRIEKHGERRGTYYTAAEPD